LIIIAIIGVIIWAVTSGSSPSTNQTKQAGPEAVVKAVFNALGQNRLSTAKNYVAANDSAAKNQLETLFANYSGYFFYDDDYINFNQMNYNVASQTESAAVVSVYGQADIVEVTYEIYEDEWGEEQEDKIEEVVEQNSFSGIKFSLEKNGAEWQLSEVPTEIF